MIWFIVAYVFIALVAYMAMPDDVYKNHLPGTVAVIAAIWPYFLSVALMAKLLRWAYR